jgi:hypothetical protein
MNYGFNGKNIKQTNKVCALFPEMAFRNNKTGSISEFV